MGFHGIYSPEIPTSIIPKNIAIAHIPLSTFSRFLRKLQNVHQCLVESPELYPGSTAYHWKQWNKVYLEEKAEDLYQKSFLSSLEIQQLIRSSNILPFKKLLSQPEKKITLRPLSEEHSYPLYPPQKTENHP
jgi:hypothetical protein